MKDNKQPTINETFEKLIEKLDEKSKHSKEQEYKVFYKRNKG